MAKKSPTMGRWHGHKFGVSTNVIRGFSGLQIKGSAETEDKIINDVKYVSRKNSKVSDVQMTVHLNARFGCKVRSEAMGLLADARAGAMDYFYVAGEKLVTFELMLTDATIKDVRMTASGQWTSADVQLTFKQCDSADPGVAVSSSSGGGGGGGGGSGSGGGGGGGGGGGYGGYDGGEKISVDTESPIDNNFAASAVSATTSFSKVYQDSVDAVSGAAPVVRPEERERLEKEKRNSDAASYVNQFTSKAKQNSVEKKGNPYGGHSFGHYMER